MKARRRGRALRVTARGRGARTDGSVRRDSPQAATRARVGDLAKARRSDRCGMRRKAVRHPKRERAQLTLQPVQPGRRGLTNADSMGPTANASTVEPGALEAL